MKIKTRSVELKHSKPPIVSQSGNDWVIRTDYPDPASPAGTCVILHADGSVSQMTIDDEGFIIDSGLVLVKRKELK